MRTFCIVALGCDKNIIDAEEAAGTLIDAGYRSVESVGDADLIVVQTCAFIREAKEESIDAILRSARDKKEGSYLVVSGCLAQRFSAELALEMPEVDLFVGVGRHTRLPELLGGERVSVGLPDDWSPGTTRRIPSTPFFTAFVKVSEGCNNRCSYCVIPSIRGSLRSRQIPDIVNEVHRLEDRGLIELNLIAQDLAAYGMDRDGAGGLVGLLRAILEETDVPWIRLLYLHPRNITDELIEMIGSQRRILTYADIPIQHINDELLRSMGRKIDKKEIISLLERMRGGVRDLFVRTSLIVGFPGEDERRFEELLDFVGEAQFNHVGVFRYSREEGTRAADLRPRVSQKVARERRDLIMARQQEISLIHNERLIGAELEVLVEGASDGGTAALRGRFFGQAPEVDGMVIITGSDAPPGRIVRVKITDALPYDLVGTIVS